MRISLIAALDQNRVIGRQGELPWHLPDDLRHFKRLTRGKPVIMGRRTFASLAGPLPDRKNIVLSRNPQLAVPGCVLAASAREALRAAEPAEEVMICGGAAIYARFLPLAQRLYLTLVDTAVEGDVLFPVWDPEAWCEIARQDHAPDEHHALAFSFLTLERKNPAPGTETTTSSGILV